MLQILLGAFFVWYLVGVYQYTTWMQKRKTLEYHEWQDYFENHVDTQKMRFIAPFHSWIAIKRWVSSVDSNAWYVNVTALWMSFIAYAVGVFVVTSSYEHPYVWLFIVSVVGAISLTIFVAKKRAS